MKNFRLVPILLLLRAQIPPATADHSTVAARAAAYDLIQRLCAVLKKEMPAGGPDRAIPVCRYVAPGPSGQLSTKTGARISRLSRNIPNSLPGPPDIWEQQVLAEFDQHAALGPSP